MRLLSRQIVFVYFALFCFVSTGFAERIRLDGFAARVNGNVILDSDVNAEIAIIKQIAFKNNKPVPSFSRDMILRKLVDRELMLQQARKFVSRTITQENILERKEKMSRRIGTPEQLTEFLSKNNISSEFWYQRARNRLILEKYIKRRIMPFVRISRAKEDEYMTEFAADLDLNLSENPLETIPDDHPIRKIVNQLLVNREVEKRKTEFLDDLRKTSEISYIDLSAADTKSED